MIWERLLGIAIVIYMTTPFALSRNKTSKEWATSAQKSIWEGSQIFHRATIGLGSFDNKINGGLVALSKSTAKVAGMLGVFGALFSIVMAFIPGAESPELKLMKSEFGKLSQKVDTIARSIEDAKKLIKIEAQRAVYIGHEQRIHHGYLQLERCLKKLDNVSCTDVKSCKREKTLIAEGFIKSMDVQNSVEAIFHGATTESTFGDSFLNLMKEESECNVPKINLLANKITALITKGMTVSMFHDLMTKSNYNVMDSTVLADEMLRKLESKREVIQHWCFRKINYWMPLDVENAQEHFTPDIQDTNTKLIRTLKKKYPWIWWHVVVHSGEKGPETGPSDSPRRRLHSSSETHKVHCFAIPTNAAKVENMHKKRLRWKKIVKTISTDPKKGVQDIENRVKEDLILENQIQSFAILPGVKWILGHFKDELQQHTLGGVNDVTTANVFVTKPPQGFIVVVSFIQTENSQTCSETCNGNGKCYIYPYSTQKGCRCKPGYSGEKCTSSETSLKLISAIDSILQNTMKLPTFASIQHSIEDTQLYLKTSTENIQKSITKLGERINEQFKSLGEFMSKKFDWFSVLFKYKEAIENLNFFYSIAGENISNFQQNNSLLTLRKKKINDQFAIAEEKDNARFLLSPTGIRKWLYQINFLIVGRRDSQFNSHKPLLFMVMEKYKSRICSLDYKKEITRTYRQLMLLQLQGYMLWSNAYSTVNRDSSAISDRYTNILKNQRRYLQDATCSVKIPHSTNLQDCTGGFYIHKTLGVNAVCQNGYFVEDPKRSEKMSQWAVKVVSKSSEYSATEYSAEQVLGKPDVSTYGDNKKAWKQGSGRGGKEEYLHVQFEKKVFAEKIEVYETFNSGAVKKIQLIQPNNKWYTVWQTATVHWLSQIRTFSPKFDVVSFLTNQANIVVDPSVSNGYIGIDAIKLIGNIKAKDTCSLLSSTKCNPCNCNITGSVSVSCDSTGQCTCKNNFYGTKCPNRDCAMTAWSAWTSCRCGYTDPKSRTRSVSVSLIGGGKRCPTTSESGTCTMVPCDCSSKPGYYGNRCENRNCVLHEWSSWSSCYNCRGYSCRTLNPQKHRSRSIKISKVGNGVECSVTRSETHSCGYTCYLQGRPTRRGDTVYHCRRD